jgi:hypothetical protein
MKFRKDIPSYNNQSQNFFNDRLQGKTRAQKEINLERHLQKFEEFKSNEDKKIKENKEHDEKFDEKNRHEKITDRRTKNQKYHHFQQKYEQQGIDNWKANMLSKKEREKKDLDYQLKEAIKYQNNVYNSITNCQNDSYKKIQNFESLLMNMQSPQENSHTNNNLNILNNISTNYNTHNYKSGNLNHSESELHEGNLPDKFPKSSALSEKMRVDITEKILLNATAKRERDRRRRKIIVEQGKAQYEIENKRREEHLIQKLHKQSNQEKQLVYESYRVEQNKNIMLQNRKLRDLMFEERYEMELNFIEKNEDEFLKTHKDNFAKDLEKEDLKKKELEISLSEKNRKNNRNMCKKMIDLIVDIAEDAYLFQQVNDAEEIDPRQWREWTQLFINNQSVKTKGSSGYDREILSRETINTPSYTGHLGNMNVLSEKNSTGNNFNINNNKENTSGLSKDNINNRIDNNNKGERERDNYEKNLTTHTNLQNAQITGGMNLDSNYNTGYGENTFYSAVPNSYSDKILDECEFIDYINYQGQWNKIIIPEKGYSPINITEIFMELSSQPIIQQAVKDPKAKGNVYTSAPSQEKRDEYKEEDQENLEIFRENIRNHYLGDIIDILVDIKFQEDETSNIPFRKFLFKHIPVKISLIGNDFSGKKSQAKILSENFPFKIYNMEELIQNALDLCNKYEFKNEVDVDLDDVIKSERLKQIANERNILSEKYARIKEIGGFIQTLLLNGDAIPDEIYVEKI